MSDLNPSDSKLPDNTAPPGGAPNIPTKSAGASPSFTPGPWEVNTQAGPNRTEVFSGNLLICDTHSGTVHRCAGTEGQPEANALLIAASPNLYAACKAFLDAPHQEHLAVRLNDEEMAAVKAMKVALAAAEGKTP